MQSELDQLNEHYQKSMDLAQRWGLNPFEVDFHIVPADKMYEIASYGIPGHFSHWTYGRDFWRQKTSYDYGASKIYELVINSDPAQAFLLETNSVLENMFVISHVIGHSDFFANNAYFENTSKQMMNHVTALADRIYSYEVEHGRSEVEKFIDYVLTIFDQVNPYHRIVSKDTSYTKVYETNEYGDLFPEEEKRRNVEEAYDKARKLNSFPYEPTRDLLGFIAEHGRLRDWQRDIMMGIREESLYFLPQMQTKIMNEGWASLIHRKMMHEIDPEIDPGGFNFAQMHSAVLSNHPGTLNPYWLGFKMFNQIIEKNSWEAALEVRAIDSDETFIRHYLDEELCEELDLFAYAYESYEPEEGGHWEITDKDWEKVRDTLAQNKVNGGRPIIEIVDADGDGAGRLVLKHEHTGIDLKMSYAKMTVKAIEKLWGRPVLLSTKVDDEYFVVRSEE